MSGAFMRIAVATVMLAGASATAQSPDWAALNAAARERALAPIRPGAPGGRPFWNGHSRAFMHQPAFDVADVPGATAYRFEIEPVSPPGETAADTSLRDDAATARPASGAERKPGGGGEARTFLAAHPWQPVDPELWDALPPGYYTLRVTPVEEGTDSAPTIFARTFYRAAVFRGPYPEAARPYREAAARVYAAVARLPQVRGWLASDGPPEGYDLYCYPSKILASMIRALCRSGGAESLAIARRMADWLLAQSEPADAPLAHFPPTYWGNRRRVAVENAGRIMLSYPAQAALAFFDLADALDARGGPAPGADPERYRAAAMGIVRTYLRLQGEDGTWPLLVRAADGEALCPNRIVPGRYLLGLFDRAIGVAKEDGDAAAIAGCRDRAFGYVEKSALVTWNWDGQFEDSRPRPPYQNLQKGVAIDAAVRLFALGRTDEALECVDWAEDQFTVWSDPIHHMDWRNWKLPTALEQYDYYTPIDASMADMVRGFAAAYAATGDALYREKARALADGLVRHQRPDGTIPTYFDERGAGADWVNCMIYSASVLEAAADAGVDAPSVDLPYGVCAHLHRVKDPAERADECRRIAEAGIRRVRFDFEWWRVQKAPGAPLDFSHYDAVVADAEAAGLTVLPILFDIPKWAEPVWEHLDAWSNFVSAVVSRYGERFPDIEIWNEENLRHFWKHEPDPALYARVLKTACAAAKAANPRVRVLFGGTAGVPLDFIRKAYENGAASSFDALCVHPYCHPRQPEGSLDAQLEALRALMAEFGDAEKPVVITELGWPTHDARLGDVGVVQAGLRVARPEQASWRAVYAATEAGADIHAALLQEALPPGSTCEACSGARLRERLAADDVDVVIYPFDETFPIDTFPEVLAFVRRGGVLVDVGGMPLWFGVREPSPGMFVRIEDKTGETTAPMRRELRIAEAANWTDQTLPREANRAFPTAAAVAAGFKGDPAGEFATRYQTPALLREGDEFVPLLVAKDSEGRDVASASVTRLAGGGAVIVSGAKNSGAGSAGEDGQARFLVRAMAMAFAEGVEQFFWYEFRGREIDPHYSEHHFGLTHRDFSPKPALAAYREFIARRPPGSVQRAVPLRDPETGVYRSEWTRPDGTVGGVRWKPGEIDNPVFY